MFQYLNRLGDGPCEFSLTSGGMEWGPFLHGLLCHLQSPRPDRGDVASEQGLLHLEGHRIPGV